MKGWDNQPRDANLSSNKLLETVLVFVKSNSGSGLDGSICTEESSS